jgi:ketosteroid isomerase-like protein
MFEGREAIVAFFGEFMKAGDLSLTLETVDVEELGDDVLEVGRYTLTITPAQGDAQKDEGKYVVVWRREDGSVKLHVDMFNTSLPPA